KMKDILKIEIVADINYLARQSRHHLRRKKGTVLLLFGITFLVLFRMILMEFVQYAIHKTIAPIDFILVSLCLFTFCELAFTYYSLMKNGHPTRLYLIIKQIRYGIFHTKELPLVHAYIFKEDGYCLTKNRASKKRYTSYNDIGVLYITDSVICDDQNLYIEHEAIENDSFYEIKALLMQKVPSDIIEKDLP
ncbi:MAG: hypothetical protein II051_04490, partial [Lachnospiraceae bacterium]|nr:hypothetical protein [Lachnospiraceae bacterium]